MDAKQLAQAIRSTVAYCQGDRYAEVRAVLGMLAETLEVLEPAVQEHGHA